MHLQATILFSGGNLNAGAYVGFPKIAYPPTPSTGFVNFGFNQSSNLFYQNASGYKRIFKNLYPADDSIYYPYKSVSTLADSVDVATNFALKKNTNDSGYSKGVTAFATTGLLIKARDSVVALIPSITNLLGKGDSTIYTSLARYKKRR